MNEDVGKKPTLVAVGGGKGGVGKSVFSILLGQWLARLGKRCVIVDLDLSCANVHTLLGIKDPSMTVKDLISKRVSSLEEVALSTSTENLRVICGASEVLSVANPVFVQKVKMVRSLSSLEADFVILDLGAGTSFNTLDFFLASDMQIVVTTVEPPAIHNAYVFLRNAVFRRLSQLSRRNETLRKLVNQTMNPENSLKLRSVKDLLEVISDLGGERLADPIRSELARIWPGVVVNKVRAVRELSTASVIRHVAHKYLLLEVAELGGVAFDRQIEKMVADMEPLTNCWEGGAYESVFEIASKLTAKVPSPQPVNVEHSQIGLAS